MQGKIGVVLGVIAIVLSAIVMVGPWWTVNSSLTVVGQTGTSVADFSLFGVSSSFTSAHVNSTNSSDYSQTPHVGSVFGAATILAVLGIVLGVGMVGLAAIPNPTFRRYAVIFGVLAFVFALLGPLYVMSSLPGAVNTDLGNTGSYNVVSGFWGTKSTDVFGITSTVTWSAGWAWYVSVAAAVLFLVAAIILVAARKPALAMPPPPGP